MDFGTFAYQFDGAKQRLTGERSGRSFKLGGSVQVQVARVDLDDKKIDLELIDSSPSGKSKRVKGKAKGDAGSGGAGKAGAKKPKAKSKPKSKGKPRPKSKAGKKPDKSGGRRK